MTVLRLFSVLVSLTLASAFVVELSPDNFDSLTRNGGDWMLEFYAPWCGHCKTLAPEYAKAATQLAGRVSFGAVDATKYRSLGLRFAINGFPTMFHVNGKTGEVRKVAAQFTSASLSHFATTAWAQYEALPYLSSPFGPVRSAMFYGIVGIEKGAYICSVIRANLLSFAVSLSPSAPPPHSPPSHGSP